MTVRQSAAGRLTIARLITAAVIATWGVAVVVPPVLLLKARQAWLTRFEHPQEQERWDAFRRDMVRQAGRDGPVQRKVPKSVEPPVRVWLRDHAVLAVTAWILFMGVLGGVFGMLVVGVTRGHAPPSLAQHQSRRESDHNEDDGRDAENSKQ